MTAVVFGRIHGKSSPPGANLDHFIGGLEVELPADGIELINRRLFHGVFGVYKDATRITHGRIQEQRKEVVTKIIMSSDILFALCNRVAIQEVMQPSQRLLQKIPPSI